jgi:DNA-binding CsgD family transcriptional regulator/PAS domain-containing protein
VFIFAPPFVVFVQVPIRCCDYVDRRWNPSVRRPDEICSAPTFHMIMDQTERLSRLIADIYDAAIDPSLWSAVLGETARYIGGSSAALFSKDATTDSGNVYYESGTDPHYRQLYFDKYVKLDPVTTGQFFAEIEQPISVADLMPYGEFLETRFYREWVQPQGVVDFLAAVLDKSATGAALFGVFRHQRDGIVDDHARRRMRLIVPHIRRAVMIGRLIDQKAAEAAAFADTFDKFGAGICLVDAEGRIVHANVACRAILDASDFLSGTCGRIGARDGKIDKTLRELFAAANEGDLAAVTGSMALPLRAQDGTRYVAHALPLASGARRLAGIAYSATMALFIRKVAVETLSSPDIIARAYKLTPTELRVLLAIVDIGGVPEVASALGVAETTIKTHLGRLFRKTGVSRQADLVKIVAGFSKPLAG